MDERPDIGPDPVRQRRARRGIVAIALALAAASLVYRLTYWTGANNTALLYIGFPTAVAIAVAYTKPAANLTGTIIKATIIAVALSGIVFAEHLLCILMAGPLFVAVAAAIGGILDAVRSRGGDGRVRMTAALLPFVLLSLEGTTEATSFDRSGAATAERVVDATAAEVEAKLASRPYYYGEVPLFLRTGFPTPTGGDGEGLEVGDERRVRFTQGAMRVRVTRSEPGSVTFARIEDDTHIRNWLEVGDSDVTWTEVAPGRTRIRWTMHYRRLLDPAWYFGPLERFGVYQAAGYLIDSVATP